LKHSEGISRRGWISSERCEVKMKVGMRRWCLTLALVTLAGVLLFGSWRTWRAWRYRTSLTEIRGLIQAGRHRSAANHLAAVLAWNPGSDEAAYLLGFCEKSLGRPDAATDVWARVPVGTGFGTLAVLGRAAVQVDRGRFADAEQLVEQTLRDSHTDGFDLRRFMTPLFWHEGRLAEARRLVETNWEVLKRSGRGGSDQAIELVRLHTVLSLGMTSVEALNSFLQRAAALAPEDDRVWLGRANLAIRRGEFDEASRWIDACLGRRAQDSPVWHARLDWAVATGCIDLAREAAGHLPVQDFAPAEVYKLAAWAAAQRRDARSEKRALESLRAIGSADGDALERLALLAIRDDQPNLAAEIRRDRIELERVSSQFRELFLRDQTIRDAPEMAHLAERLGRVFEATVFLNVACAGEPARDDLRNALARLQNRQAEVGKPGQTLADAAFVQLDSARASAPP
jgi:enediyne biosynthesis protein E4